MESQIILLIFILVLSIFLGGANTKVPSTLHTPLMSGATQYLGTTLLNSVRFLQK